MLIYSVLPLHNSSVNFARLSSSETKDFAVYLVIPRLQNTDVMLNLGLTQNVQPVTNLSVFVSALTPLALCDIWNGHGKFG